MLIKEAEYKKVKVTQQRMVKDAIYGCDECGTEINEYPNEEDRLEVTVFYQDFERTEKTGRLHFCSWECVFKHLPKIKCDHFISLPFVYMDGQQKTKRCGRHLMEILSELNTSKK